MCVTATNADWSRDVYWWPYYSVSGHDFFWQVVIKTNDTCPLIYIAFLENSVDVNVMQKWFCVYRHKQPDLRLKYLNRVFTWGNVLYTQKLRGTENSSLWRLSGPWTPPTRDRKRASPYYCDNPNPPWGQNRACLEPLIASNRNQLKRKKDIYYKDSGWLTDS